MKVICGLGNPGPEYEATRHNVGWWVLEALRRAWGFPPFETKGIARFTDGERVALAAPAAPEPPDASERPVAAGAPAAPAAAEPPVASEPPVATDAPQAPGASAAPGEAIVLVEPLTYMNRSGTALAPLARLAGFDVARDLLVIVDDVNLAVGRTRLRPAGSAGGHNGLASVEAALGTRDYARLRVGVGGKPPGESLSDWVLAPMPPEDEETVLGLLPALVTCVEAWLDQGAEAAMQRCNR